MAIIHPRWELADAPRMNAAALQSPGDKHQPCVHAVAPPDTPEAEVLKEAIFVAVRACAPKMISTLKK